MPKYQYTAMDGRGKEQKGRIDADTEQDAAAKLKQMGLFPTGLSELKARGAAKPEKPRVAAKAGGGIGPLSGMSFGTPKIKTKDLTTFTRQLATLLEAGLPLVRALRTLERQARNNPPVRRVVGDLAGSVEGGSTFSEALAAHPKSFSRLYINMVRAGEASGAMETVLTRLAEFMEKAQRLAGRVKAAMVYPVVVLTVALTITAGLMIFIVPKFSKIFDEMLPGESMPAVTMVVIGISNFMQAHIVVVLIIIASIIVAFKLLKKTKAGAYLLDLVAVKVPPFNQLAIKSVVARFCRTLGTLMQSGVAVLQALTIVRDTAGNEIVARAIQHVHDAVKEGEGMSRPLDQANLFPSMVVSMIEVGEETGALPEMLNRIADVYEEEVDRAAEALPSMIEPVLIVFLAVIVGTIVVAMFMPLIKLIDKLGG